VHYYSSDLLDLCIAVAYDDLWLPGAVVKLVALSS